MKHAKWSTVIDEKKLLIYLFIYLFKSNYNFFKLIEVYI